MFTKGIRKILIVVDIRYGNVDKLGELADSTGHKAILHEDIIYVKVGTSWNETPFTMDDFKDA